MPAGRPVADVGSRVPGCPACRSRSCARTSQVVLVEPLLRRATFLQEAVDGVSGVVATGSRCVRGRAEDAGGSRVDVVTARAVAPLDRLAGWTLPLLRVGGALLALKGAGALPARSHAAAAPRSSSARRRQDVRGASRSGRGDRRPARPRCVRAIARAATGCRQAGRR